MLMNITTQNITSLPFLNQVLIIPLRGQRNLCSRWTSCQFYTIFFITTFAKMLFSTRFWCFLFQLSNYHLLCLQSKDPKLSAREFSRRSIKERAALLSSMFPGSNKSPTAPLSLSESQVVCYSSYWHGLVCALIISKLSLQHVCDNCFSKCAKWTF